MDKKINEALVIIRKDGSYKLNREACIDIGDAKYEVIPIEPLGEIWTSLQLSRLVQFC